MLAAVGGLWVAWNDCSSARTYRCPDFIKVVNVRFTNAEQTLLFFFRQSRFHSLNFRVGGISAVHIEVAVSGALKPLVTHSFTLTEQLNEKRVIGSLDRLV